MIEGGEKGGETKTEGREGGDGASHTNLTHGSSLWDGSGARQDA